MNTMADLSPDEAQDSSARARIIAAAAALVERGGVPAVTTRAVAQAACVQPPAIYRLFGDKDGLMNAVAEEVFRSYVSSKIPPDPAADVGRQLRDGWDQHVAFGLAHPAIFVLISTMVSSAPSRAWEAGLAVLKERVRLAARAGWLKVSEEKGVSLIHSMGTGTVLTLLRLPARERSGLSEAAREGVLSLVLDEKTPETHQAPVGLASALRTHVASMTRLTPGERLLMDELLRRIATPASLPQEGTHPTQNS